MPVPKELLEILACPVCREEVKPTVGEALEPSVGEALEPSVGGGLRCVKCGRVYPVRDDIPIMLAEEASIDGTS